MATVSLGGIPRRIVNSCSLNLDGAITLLARAGAHRSVSLICCFCSYSKLNYVNPTKRSYSNSVLIDSPSRPPDTHHLPHMSPDAEISFEVDPELDQINNSNEFIKFNPLPSKWARVRNNRQKFPTVDSLTGHKLSTDEIYTGRPKNTIPSISYYSEMVENYGTLPELKTDESRILFQSIESYITNCALPATDKLSSFIGPECYKTTILPGDLIEVCSRDGQTVFGLVLGFNERTRKISILSIDGTLSNIRLRNSSHSPSRNISIILRGLFSSHHMESLISSDSQFLNNQIFIHFMIRFIRESFKIMPSLSPYLQPVYAYLAQPSTLQATNLDYIAKRMVAASRNALKSKINASPLSQLSIIFATYLSTCGNNLRFARLSLDSPIIALSEKSFDAIVKIMHYLTDQELNLYVNTFQQLLSSSDNSEVDNMARALIPPSDEVNLISSPDDLKSSSSTKTPTGLAPILDFFQHYIVAPDPRLSDAIRSIISKIYPNRDSDLWLSSPSTVHKLLCDTGLADRDNPILIPGSLAWPDADGSLINDLHKKFQIEFNKNRRPKPLFHNRLDWEKFPLSSPNSLPVYKFSDVKNIGFSIAKNGAKKSRKWTFYIHIPDLTSILDQKEPAVKTLFRIGKSWNVPFSEQLLNLFPEDFVNKSLDGNLRKCWTFSVSVPAFGESEFNLEECEVFQTTIPKALQVEINHPSGADKSRDYNRDSVVKDDILRNNNHHLTRTNVQDISSIKSLLENFFWKRIENGSVFDAPISARTYCPSERDTARPRILEFTIADIIQESRVLAGMIAGNVGRREQIPLPYLGQYKLGPTHENLILDVSKERRVKGCIAPSNRVLAESHLSQEIMSSVAVPYAGLGAINGYVHIANPFEDTLSLCSQWALNEYLQKKAMESDNSSGKSDLETVFKRNVLYNNKSHSLKYIENQVLVQRDLVSSFHQKLHRFSSLRRLEEELRASKNYFIFRCQIVEEADFPEMAVAYCHELQLLVDIALLPDTSVIASDSVLCTEIIELNPVDGLLVLGL